MNITDLNVKFLSKCNAENLANTTLDTYNYHIKDFIKFVSRYNDLHIENINQNTIIEYLAHLRKCNYQPVTIKDRFIVLKMFFDYLYKSNIITINPLSYIKLPKIPKKTIYSFEKQEVIEIINFFDRSEFIGFRNYTIMNVLFGTGIRKSELLNLNLFDVRQDIDVLSIIGKGQKERIVPISRILKRILSQYLKRRNDYILKHNNNFTTASVFITKDCRRLSSGGLNTIFRQLKNSKNNWSTRVSPHTFRHTFAKFYILNGGDPYSLQEILGHEDISTTKLYIDMNDTEVKVQNDKFNPLDNTRWQYY